MRYFINKYTVSILLGLLIYSGILTWFICSNSAFSGSSIVAENADHFGSLIGGVIGSLFSFLSLIVLIINIKESNDNSIKNDQENRFFSLLNIYNDYCKDLYIESWEENKEIRGKKTFLIITREFSRIYKTVDEIIDYPLYNKIELAFYVLYYGVGPKSTSQLESALKRIILDNQEVANIIKKAEEIYKNPDLWRFKYYKPFGGHQSRLYQYLNLLEQMLKFIDNLTITSESVKNKYVEIFKSQLSLYEYLVILVAANTIKPSLKNYIQQYKFIIKENELFFESFNNKNYDMNLNQYFKDSFNHELN